MCGFVFLRTSRLINKKELIACSKKISNRGPDESKYFHVKDQYNFNICSIHYLLDISGKKILQPLNKNPIMLFNGEIYNFDKKKFSADTFYLNSKKSDEKKQILDGEFSILKYFLDKNTCEIKIDTFNTKPLFYSINDNFDFGVASYKSALEKLNFKKIIKFEPNRRYIFKCTKKVIISKVYENYNFKFTLIQNKKSLNRWNEAFIESVRKRAIHGKSNIFVCLSSGYDSGSICAALNLLNIKYKTYSFLKNEDHKIIKERVKINLKKSCTSHQNLPTLNTLDYLVHKFLLKKKTDNFKYYHYDFPNKKISLNDDKGAIGTMIIAKRARRDKNYVSLSSCGADEIYSDYAMNGKKIAFHSQFKGIFPRNLKKIFPWKKFYNDSMRSYLFKEEYIFGMYGIESRYPFLDNNLTQEFLSLDHYIKNFRYKNPLHNFMSEQKYPFKVEKRGFDPLKKDIINIYIDKFLNFIT